MPIAFGPGGMYSALIVSEPCAGGFKATIPSVIRLLPSSVAGSAVEHDPFPEFVAESKFKAERNAAIYFKGWAKIQKRGTR